ncbi:AgmX/PglI C-terminal domain-containing protein [Bradymonas sediminis]|uniref:Uncharacterized protein n=1 Tax=Bradymonas sediminis TaxID=1548548 RepID=A0A2Z4FM86_9DELT|nr:AgmX/PglI C-terminal domain-containing protein [Bradymonas sediminis]AWV89788.1 hypothetical protein DN745_10745 [Bradymonas sediminis]TDP76465.1 hypothetical protein DFR33_10294 [Bradymonas sediminis]
MSSKSGSNKSGKKVLRIGLIQNGKILEERVFRAASNVRVGTDISKNELVVPASNLPKSFQVFEAASGAYTLCFDSKMTGRVSTGNGVRTLKELISQGKATKTATGYSVALTPRARGKIQIGEVTILFQFVTPPPPIARPVLPASMRGGWFRGMDYYLVAMIALSALLQIGFVTYLQLHEWPEQIDGLNHNIPDRFVELMKAPEPEEPIVPDAVETPEDGDGEPDDSKEAKKPDPKPPVKSEPKKTEADPKPSTEEKPAPTAEEIAAAKAAEKKRMEDEVRNSTMLGKLGSVNGDGPSIVDSLVDGAANVGMDEAFADTKGVKEGVAGYEKSGLRSGGSSDADGSGSTASIGDLGASSGTKKAEKGVDTGSKKEEKVTAKMDIKDGNPVVGTGTLDANSISKVVQRNAKAIQSCFERVLKTNPNAGGRLVITVTIGRAGRPTSVKANTSIGGGFKSCTERAVKSWRFDRPKGGDVMFNKTFVLQGSK